MQPDALAGKNAEAEVDGAVDGVPIDDLSDFTHFVFVHGVFFDNWVLTSSCRCMTPEYENKPMPRNWYKKADGFGDDQGYVYLPSFNRGRMKPESLQKIVALLDEVFRYERDVGRQVADAVVSEISPMQLRLPVDMRSIEGDLSDEAGSDQRRESMHRLTDMLVGAVADMATSGRFPKHPKAARIERRRNSSVREAAAIEKISRMAGAGGPISRMMGSRHGEFFRELQAQLRAEFGRAASYCPPPIQVSDKAGLNSRVFRQHFACLLDSLRNPGSFDECMGREIAHATADIGEFPGNEDGNVTVSPAEAFEIEARGEYANWMPNLIYSERNRLAQVMREYMKKKTPPPSEDPFALWYIDRVRSGKMPLFKTMLGGPNLLYRHLQSIDSLRKSQREGYEPYSHAPISNIAIGTWNFILDSLIRIGEQRYGDRFATWMDANERLLRRI